MLRARNTHGCVVYFNKIGSKIRRFEDVKLAMEALKAMIDGARFGRRFDILPKRKADTKCGAERHARFIQRDDDRLLVFSFTSTSTPASSPKGHLDVRISDTRPVLQQISALFVRKPVRKPPRIPYRTSTRFDAGRESSLRSAN